MKRNRLLALLPSALLLAACSPTTSTSETSSDRRAHDQRGPTPGEETGSAPLACARSAPDPQLLEHLSGPAQAVTRQVAATRDHFFVATGTTVRRGTSSDDVELLASAPREHINLLVATSNQVFLVTTGGVWRSTDEGDTWMQAIGGLTGELVSLRTSDDTVVGTDYGGNVLSWSSNANGWMPLSDQSFFATLATSDGTTILADTGVEVLRREASGRWSQALGLEAWGYRDLAVRGDESLAITAGGEIRFSLDGGKTFAISSRDTASFGTASRIAFGNQLAFATTQSGVIRSSDQGQTWSLAVPTPGNDADGSLAVRGDMVVSSTDDVRVSNDEGAHFAPPLSLGDASVVSLAQAGPFVFASTADNRVHTSADLGKTWVDLDTQGFMVRKGQKDGDSLYLFLSQSNDPAVYAAQSLVRSTDGGLSFDAIDGPTDSGLSSFGGFTASEGRLFVGSTVDLDSAYDPSAPRGTGVFRSDDGGETWEPTSDGLPARVVEGATSYPGILALESSGGAIFALLAHDAPYRSVDGGETWQKIDGGLAPLAARALDQLIARQGRVYASSHAFGSGLYRFSTTYAAWQRLEAHGLPDSFAVNAIEESDGLLFVSVEDPVGNASGLYVSTDDGASFESVSDEALSRSLLLMGDELFAGADDEGLFRLPIPACDSH